MTRFAVDGIDCAGKSTLADALGSLLHAERLTIDDFLELNDLWDVRIWVDTSFERALERALVRDADMPELRRRYEERYFPGQRLYIDDVDPRSRAEIVVAA